MSVRHLVVRRGPLLALDDVSLDIPPGRITAVVGGDGAGKTTLLEAIAGLVPIAGGSVDRPDRRRLGYLPWDAGSWADLTVDENVAFVGGCYGLSGDRLQQRATDLLGRAGLLDARDRLAGRLSGGMRRKLGFCLAMLHQPDLLVLDEPSTGVDPVSRVELWRLISQAAAGGTAVVLATSYIDEAERAGWVLVLQRGRMLLSGTPGDLVAGCPGEVATTTHPQQPEYAWRSGDHYRQWWPDGAPADEERTAPTLEDVAIVASLRTASAA